MRLSLDKIPLQSRIRLRHSKLETRSPQLRSAECANLECRTLSALDKLLPGDHPSRPTFLYATTADYPSEDR